jgi:hypothetical protein
VRVVDFELITGPSILRRDFGLGDFPAMVIDVEVDVA